MAAWTPTATGPKRASEASALGARHCPATGMPNLPLAEIPNNGEHSGPS